LEEVQNLERNNINADSNFTLNLVFLRVERSFIITIKIPNDINSILDLFNLTNNILKPKKINNISLNYWRISIDEP